MAERIDGDGEDTTDDIGLEFQMFKERLSTRYSNVTVSASNVQEKLGTGRRRSSVMIEYFRQNYMGIEARSNENSDILYGFNGVIIGIKS
ncbi:hypothetical protein MAR_031203 [Mya arenaria]|uniref:Uncharacterized protein n=1 Tax=Mya arenaria TaxID=6604 RepID=A0ABY7F766_MYAAR|nr:hypothetical protein MAR_031203 [Mya arenaria]